MKNFAFPLVFVAAVLGLLAWAIYLMNTGQLSPRDIPSPLIDKPLPAFSLPTLEDPKKVMSKADWQGKVVLINVWASWCVACKQEHPVLVELGRRKIVPLIGLNYKDARAAAESTLRAGGNPYDVSLVDADGRVGIDWGVYGVPETFLIDKQGIIRYKHIGPISPEDLEKKILPLVRELSV
ncbi:MAG TPA: DsbE family thiol:disulfide interchange protein [Acidiferrobacterales bacterium]